MFYNLFVNNFLLIKNVHVNVHSGQVVAKLQCKADIMFVLFGFSCFAYTELVTY